MLNFRIIKTVGKAENNPATAGEAYDEIIGDPGTTFSTIAKFDSREEAEKVLTQYTSQKTVYSRHAVCEIYHLDDWMEGSIIRFSEFGSEKIGVLTPVIEGLRFIPEEKLTRVSYWSSEERCRMGMDASMSAFAMNEDLHFTDDDDCARYWCEKEERPRRGYTYVTTENGDYYGFVKDKKLITVVWECDALYSGWGTTGPEGRGISDARKPDAYTIIDAEIVYLCLHC